MAKEVHRLNDRAVKAAKPGHNGKSLYLHDGHGLYLQVISATGKSWCYRYKVHGKTRDCGLGSYPAVPLAMARQKAEEMRQLRAEGKDPIERKRAQRAAEQAAAANSISFRQAAEQLIDSKQAGWRNAKHAKQWPSTLSTYAYPIIGSKAVGNVNADDVLAVLRKDDLWTHKTETASRLRARIELVLAYAEARGWREPGPNPAEWRRLRHILPKRSKVKPVAHHPAMPWHNLPAFMDELRAKDDIASRALEWLILTATRTGETLGARFSEINVAQRLWIIPKGRVKAGKRAHRVPLSARCLELLAEMERTRTSDFLFPGYWGVGRQLNGTALRIALQRIRPKADCVVHGFRSSFRDWTAEATNTPNIVGEMALGHEIPGGSERAYRRGDLLERRRELMQQWADYCAG
jgi:integrase